MRDTLHLSEKTVKITLKKIYEDRKEDFLGRLMEFYKKHFKMLPVSPLWDGREKSIMDIFVPIQLNRVAIEKSGSRGDTEHTVDTYKDMFYTDTTLIDRVSIQGDPGMGKTTFLSKLVHDWCDSDTSKETNLRSNFSDVETLQDFRFVFHIKLRDSIGQSEVKEMIKTQIIDEIYFNKMQQEEAYDLLGRVLERETCLVTLDGLNEWTDHTHKKPIPKMYTLAKQCVVLVTSRPWKMADKRIRDSEIGTLLEVVGVTDTAQLIQNLLRSLTTDNKLTYRKFMENVEERNLNHFLTSPWMLTLLVNLWVNTSLLSGSLCKINIALIETLLNKGLEKEEFDEPSPLEHSVFGHHTEIGNALARVAFKYTFGRKKSLVLCKHELLSPEMLSREQLDFAIKTGVLNERYYISASSRKVHVSFLHETIQEFFAASYIANFLEDKTMAVFSKSNCNVLEVSQVLIYLSGLKWDVANKAIQTLTEEFSDDVNEGLDLVMIGSLCPRATSTFQNTVVNTQTKLNSEIGINLSFDLGGLVLTILVQNMMINCYHEAKVSKEKNINLKMSDFIFHQYLNKMQNDDLLQILMMNKSNVRTLLLERNVLQEHTILTVLEQSKHCIERLKMSGSRGIVSALPNRNLKQLTLIGNIDVTLFSELLPSFINLTFLRIEECDFNKDIYPPPSVEYLCLLKSRCSVEFVGRLLVHLAPLMHTVRLNLGEVYKTANHDLYIKEMRQRVSSCDISKINLCFGKDVAEPFELLNASNLESITFETADVFLLASDRLHSLNKIKIIRLFRTYIGSFKTQLSTRLQQIEYCKLYLEKFYSLLSTLSSFDHPVRCELRDVVLQSSKETCVDDLQKNVSDLRSKIRSHDMSNIEIIVYICSIELFEILHGSSIGVLGLGTTECASLASGMLHTLNRLADLHLRGTFTGRCDLRLPDSIQRIFLQDSECSSEWLCSLLITLSSLDHHVKCVMWGVVFHPSEENRQDESQTDISDFRSLNLSNIKIRIHKVSTELLETLGDTNIEIRQLPEQTAPGKYFRNLHFANLSTLFLEDFASLL
ncbi:hypothetical protein DPMN_128580 [Dreissena polymorpha]|uniref:NACHT domain-containing protein n=1 Tax=Dreissena polymorpha TaxID=45954 RepID=A0A9D4JWK4_DREPO|nr:hypothetical protein DPMN_128580 [Dreissena polymorpha]